MVEKDLTKPLYGYTLSELIDRLTIVQLKETFNPELKEAYAKEITDLIHDINLKLPKSSSPTVTGEFIRDVIVLAQYNHHIWANEDAERKADMEEKDIDWEKRYKQLRLTHSLNGIRNKCKNKLQSLVGGRKEHKNQCLAADDAGQWTPSGY